MCTFFEIHGILEPGTLLSINSLLTAVTILLSFFCTLLLVTLQLYVLRSIPTVGATITLDFGLSPLRFLRPVCNWNDMSSSSLVIVLCLNFVWRCSVW